MNLMTMARRLNEARRLFGRGVYTRKYSIRNSVLMKMDGIVMYFFHVDSFQMLTFIINVPCD